MNEALLTTAIVALIGPVVLQLIRRIKPRETTADIISNYDSILKQFGNENRRLRRENLDLRLEIKTLKEENEERRT